MPKIVEAHVPQPRFARREGETHQRCQMRRAHLNQFAHLAPRRRRVALRFAEVIGDLEIRVARILHERINIDARLGY